MILNSIVIIPRLRAFAIHIAKLLPNFPAKPLSMNHLYDFNYFYFLPTFAPIYFTIKSSST